MSTNEVFGNDATSGASVARVDMKLEVVVIPVSDVNRAKEFYGRLGWRLDQTPAGVVQFTPHGSGCSVQFGTNLTSAAPGSAKGYLIVSDIEIARDELVAADIEVSEVFHAGTDCRVSGLDPERRSYRSFASFSDPDGNGWLLQEITTRLPGRIDPGATSFGSASDLASALRRACTRRTSRASPHLAGPVRSSCLPCAASVNNNFHPRLKPGDRGDFLDVRILSHGKLASRKSHPRRRFAGHLPEFRRHFRTSRSRREPPSSPGGGDDRAAIQAEVGDDAFEAAQAKGRAMTLEQAVEYALAEADPKAVPLLRVAVRLF